MDLVSQRPASGRGFTLRVVLIAFAFVAMLAIAPRAEAAELVYWDNYQASPQSISVANIDGSGGGPLNLTGVPLGNPEGMAIDSVTGRLYVASNTEGPEGKGQILFVNLDGSGGGVLSTPGAPVDQPRGIAVDPTARIVYWTNVNGNGAADGSIAWAKLDGSGGGMLNTTGATLESPYKIALDPVGGRVFWANTKPNPDTISYAFVNNTGGGNLDLTGMPPAPGTYALAIDSVGGRIYSLQSSAKKILYASLGGGGGGEVNIAGATFEEPFGLAIDQAMGRLYWANFELKEVRTNAIGFANLAGGVGGISPVTAPVSGAQDPVILKSPSGTGSPLATRSAKTRSELTCPTGSWAADFVGSFVYQAPQTYAYQWTRNGKAIAGETTTELTAKSEGKYGCVVTATNAAGSAAQTSAPVKVSASKLKLAVKTKKVSAKAGSVATFKVQVLNQGDLQAKKPKLCIKVPKKAKKDLKASKCKSLGKVNSRKKRLAKLKVKIGPDAEGTYELKIVVKGSSGKSVKAKLQVFG